MTVKPRNPTKTSTLLDIFQAFTFSENVALTANHPESPSLPRPLVDCLAKVLSMGVLLVMTYRGVCRFLDLLIRTCFVLIYGTEQDESETRVVVDAIVGNRPIESHKWIPSDWVLSTQKSTPTFSVSVCDFGEENAPMDIMARLEQFIGNANRRLDIFIELNNALTTLQSLGKEPTQTSVLPVCYSFSSKRSQSTQKLQSETRKFPLF